MNPENSSPFVLRTVKELRAWRKSVEGSVGFVPTMGALHAGHAHLLEVSRAHNPTTVLSIFVNPSQFGPKEDFSKYPRTLEEDLRIARQSGVSAVFFPDVAEVYPEGFSTYVEETKLSTVLCGGYRQWGEGSHFRGVTTVVLKLLNLVQPDRAYFGLKDAQQFFILHKMARDLGVPVSIEGVTTVREPDGLALSSRNRYLSAGERECAPLLARVLREAARAWPAGAHSDLLEAARVRLTAAGFQVQYLEARALPNLGEPLLQGPTLLAAAAFLGSTRLIDNVLLGSDLLASHGIVIHSQSV